jgi:hypothetical protein
MSAQKIKKEEIEEEKYLFLRLAEMDFKQVLWKIKILKRYRKLDVKYALLESIVVSYIRPFTKSKGIKKKEHRLSKKYVPEEYKNLHKKLCERRHKLFAHTELKYFNPQVSRWGENWYPMSLKGRQYEELNSKVDDIRSLAKILLDKTKEEIQKYQSIFDKDYSSDKLYFT